MFVILYVIMDVVSFMFVILYVIIMDVYRLFQLAKKYHPDVNKDPSGAKTFQEVSEAYEVIYIQIQVYCV